MTNPTVSPTNTAAETTRTGNALLQAVHAAISTLTGIERHRPRMGNEPVDLTLEVIKDARRRIDRKELFVCVVGEKKAGKSTFLNAILGEPILSAEVRECTGTVTFIRSSSDYDYRAELTSQRIESFNDIFPDRRIQIARSCDTATRHLEDCVQCVDRLPMELTTYQKSLKTLMQSKETLLSEIELAATKYDELCTQLGTQSSAYRSFDESIKQNSKSVPYAYRQPASWKNPIRWAGQKWMDKKAKPEWKEHLDNVVKCQQMRDELEAFRLVVDNALRHREELQTRRQKLESQQSDFEKSISITTRRINLLPKRTEVCELRLKRLETYRSTYQTRRHTVFLESVKHLTDQNKRGPEVNRLELWVPNAQIPRDVVIIDTPGVNTDNQTNKSRAWDTIRREADGCIVLSDIQQTVSQSTREFVHTVKSFIPHLILILTKLDRALESVEFDDNPQEQIDEAIRIGEDRFANAVGRTKEDILSFAVSALPALKREAKALNRFQHDVSKIVEILYNERAIIIATRCATTIATINSQIASAQELAEREYAKAIGDLEGNRIPNPSAYCRDQMKTVLDDINDLASSIVSEGVHMIDESYEAICQSYVNQIMACSSSEQLKNVLSTAQSSIPSQLQNVNKEIQKQLASPTTNALQQLEQPLLYAIRERYRIVQQLTSTTSKQLTKTQLGVSNNTPAMNLNLTGAVDDFNNTKMMGVAGGAAAGAVLGSVVPGLGTVIGGIVGGVAGLLFGPSFDEVRRNCMQKFVATMADTKVRAIREFESSQPVIEKHLRSVLEKTLSTATSQYGQWIDSIIAEERRRIDEERANLSHLVQIRSQMIEHLQKIEQLIGTARQQSRGLAK
jgi:gas vesicle protein/GTP-binding protein EngB required for normal cell division